MRIKTRVQTVVLVLAISIIAYAKVTGPEPGYTNAPGDIGSCVNCHDTFHEINVGPGTVTIGNVPATYTPGQQYTLLVRVQQAGRQKFGFQLTALNNSNGRAGTLAPLGGDTQVNPDTGTGNRQYIEHTEGGTLPNGSGSRTWQVRWTAPSTDIGTVRFFAGGNAANGDGTNQEDYIYTNSAISESPTSTVTMAFEAQPDGMNLTVGSQFTIRWLPTGLSNITSYELRYSTDDGQTFPISQLIQTITNPLTTSYEWTIPNKPTNQGRLRVQALTGSGTAVEIRSGRFTISGSGGPLLPVISSVSVEGKKLLISGENFQDDAKVRMNGAIQKTKNDSDDPSGELICKKAAKSIPSGGTVQLIVENPDGTSSATFLFTKP